MSQRCRLVKIVSCPQLPVTAIGLLTSLWWPWSSPECAAPPNDLKETEVASLFTKKLDCTCFPATIRRCWATQMILDIALNNEKLCCTQRYEFVCSSLFLLHVSIFTLHLRSTVHSTQYTVDTPAGRACRKMPGNPGWSSGRIFRAVVTSSFVTSTSQWSTLSYSPELLVSSSSLLRTVNAEFYQVTAGNK